MRAHRGILAALAVTALVLLAAVPPASAQETDDLRVWSVEGRAITLQMPLPAALVVDETTSLSGVVEINGQVVPATVKPPAPAEQDERAVVLVLDTSGSMAGQPMASARRAATAYLSALPEDVQAGLVTFADQVSVLMRPGVDHAQIAAALARVRPEGETSLFDGVSAALDLLPPAAQGRLVVLTDGQDTVSRASLAQIVSRATAAGAVVDVVLLDPTDADRQVASDLAVGGTVTSARTASELVAEFEQAAAVWVPWLALRAVVPADVDASGGTAVVTVSVGGEVIEASTVLPMTTSLGLPDAPPVTVSQEPTPIPRQASVVPAIVSAAAGVIVILLSAWALVVARAGRTRRARIAQVLAYASATTGIPGTPRDPALDPAWSRLGRRYALSADGRKLDHRLAAAELPVSPAMWRGLEIVSLVPLLVITWLLVGRLWLAALLTLVLVPLAFGSILRFRVSRRQRAFSDELPEFLLLLSSALRAGLSFSQSLESAAEQHRGQVGRQIRRALAEAQLSAHLDDALLACADRMGNDDLRWTVTALSVQREVGGNLSSILDSAASTIKGRHALSREVRTLSAEGRLSAYVLIALPLGVLAFLVLFRREYVSQLWTHPLGIAMMIALVILLVVGWVWMRAIGRIRV